MDSESQYRTLLQSLDQGFCMVEMLFDAGDRAVDYQFIETNPAFERQTGLGDVTGKRMRALRPNHEAFWFETFGRIARTGAPEKFEHQSEEFGRWFEVQAFRTGEPDRRRVAMLLTDISELRRVQAALKESEQRALPAQAGERRFQDFAANSADTLWIVDVEANSLEYLSPAFETMWGEPRDRIMAELGRWAEMVHPDDLPGAAELMPNAALRGTCTYTYRILRADTGETRWIRDTGFPIPDPDGSVRRIGGVSQDVTDWMRAENALAASQVRLQSLVEGIPQLVWRATDYGLWTWASPQWTEFTGQSEIASHGWGWLEPLHPDDRGKARDAWERTRTTGIFDVEYRVRNGRTGLYCWFRTRATAVRDSSGALIEWLGTSTDIDELRDLQQRQQLLLAELQHRVRNTLGIITSIARRTAESSGSLDEMAAHLEGRIEAFSRVQAAVTRDPAGAVELTSLIENELLAHAARDGRQLKIRGPQLMLRPRAAESISLAVHELATNAVKHGALSAVKGRIDVSWRVTDDMFQLSWKESGLGQEVRLPTREGFGLAMLLQSLPYDLDAETKAGFEPDGLRFTLNAPVKGMLVEETGYRN